MYRPILSARQAADLPPGRELDTYLARELFGVPTIKPYSTCISAAFEVVAAMSARGWRVRLCESLRGNGEYFADFTHDDWMPLELEVRGTTAAHALSLAAVHALSIQETTCKTIKEMSRVRWTRDRQRDQRTWQVDSPPFYYLDECHFFITDETTDAIARAVDLRPVARHLVRAENQ